MVDHTRLVIERLTASSPLVAALGASGMIVGGALPAYFNPDGGPCVVVNTEGGSTFEEAPIARARIKVRVWAGIAEYELARQISNLIHDSLDAGPPNPANMIALASGLIISSRCSVFGQDLVDPDSGWATVFGYYDVTARETFS